MPGGSREQQGMLLHQDGPSSNSQPQTAPQGHTLQHNNQLPPKALPSHSLHPSHLPGQALLHHGLPHLVHHGHTQTF